MDTLAIKVIAIVVFCAAILGTIAGVKMHIDKLNSEIAVLTAQNQTLDAANKQDAANILASNQAVSALQAKNQQQSQAAATALAQAQKIAQSRQQEISQLQTQKASGNETQDCDTLNQNLNDLITTFGSKE